MSKPVIVLADTNYPNLNECFNWRTLRQSKECLYPGFYIELFDLFRTHLNVTVKFIDGSKHEDYPPGVDLGLPEDEIILGAVRNGSLDFISYFVDNTTSYGNDFDFTLPIYFSESKFVVARSESSLTGIFDFFTVYDSYVWLGIIACFVSILLIRFFIYQMASRFIVKESESFGSLVWQLARLSLIQTEQIRQKLLSSRLRAWVEGVWVPELPATEFTGGNTLTLIFALLQCGVVVRMYNNLITTQAIRYVDPRPFKANEVVQFLAEKRYSFVTRTKYTWWYQSIMNENITESPFYELRQAVKNNPIQLAAELGVRDDDIDAYVMDKVKLGHWMTIESSEGVEFTRQIGYCNMVYLETGFPLKSKHLFTRKGHPLLPKINKILLDETVRVRLLYEKYYKYTKPLKCEQERQGPKALTLSPFYGVCVIFCSGSSLSIIAFFVETCLERRRKKESVIVL